MAIRNFYRILLHNYASQVYDPNTFRYYSRWTHRKPAKTLLPFIPTEKTNLKKERVIDLDPKILNKVEKSNKSEAKASIPDCVNTLPELKNPGHRHKKEVKVNEKREKLMYYLNQQKVFDENHEIIYEKLKNNDGRISTLLVKLKTKKERLRSGQILVEGWRLIADGLEAKCPLNYLIFSQIEDLQRIRPFLPQTGVKIYKIPYKEIQLWSDLETPPGIFGVFQTPTIENVNVMSQPLPLKIICDNIRVPGNLGTILRVAVGAGAEKVILSKGCVDVWDSKVLRSAAGAHFRLPIHNSVDWEDMKNYIDSDTSIFIADNNTTVNDDNIDSKEGNVIGSSIPVLPYYSIDFPSLKSITLVVGGETEGISTQSYLLAEQLNGLRLNIPLQQGVDSLNTGMAAGIIAFEIKKQILQATAKDKLQNTQTI